MSFYVVIVVPSSAVLCSGDPRSSFIVCFLGGKTIHIGALMKDKVKVRGLEMNFERRYASSTAAEEGSQAKMYGYTC